MTEYTTTAAHAALRAAVGELCREGMLAHRLDAAHRALAGIDHAVQLPPSLRFRFEELMADFAYGAETVGEALARMSAPDREHLAGRLLSIFDEAVRALAPES